MSRQEIEKACIDAAERKVVSGISADLLASIAVENAKYAAGGGCNGCGSKYIAVHYGECPTLREPNFY